jgi:predicted nucleic acid-binding protein
VGNAERLYADPSALRRLYVHDEQSRSFCAWRSRVGDGLPLTLHGRAELVNAISLAVFRRDVTPSAGAAALADLEADLASGRLALAHPPWRQAFTRAADLSRVHTPRLGTRSLDVLHVASALVLGCRQLVTYDDRQASLGRAVGLRVVSP